MAKKTAEEWLKSINNFSSDSSDSKTPLINYAIKRMIGQPPHSVQQESAAKNVEERDKDSQSEYLPSDSNPESDSNGELNETELEVAIEQQNESNEDIPGPSKKRSRWKQLKPDEWKKNVRKRARCLGEEYTDEQGKIKIAKLPKPLPNHSHKEPSGYKCSLFTEEDRLEIFNDYWKKRDGFKAKRNFLLKFTKAIPVKRRRSEKETNFRKNLAYEYILPKSNKNLKVCREFFCATLAISYKPIAFANKDRSNTGEFLGNDQRGKHEPHNKLKPEVTAAIKNHIESFPLVESHYCRKSSKRLYLSSSLSISKMYDLFKEKVAGTDAEKVSYEKYKQVFGQEYNMAFHKPKKDLCVMCTLAQSAAGPSEEQKLEFETHIKRKESSRAAMRSNIEKCSTDKELTVATMDLQSVLQIPQAEASPFYYKRKLCVYNFTVYNEATREGNCYIWSEIDGKRGSNEIGSCVKRFIEGLTEKGCRKVVLWSDNCSGQNRNRYIAAMLLKLVQESAVEIVEQNFLEVGHTQMDVDSMHSAIEHSAKNCSIFSMNDWSNVIRQARRKHPYNVVRMLHSDFIDLKSVNARSMKKVIAFENGEKLNWLKVKSLIFSKSMQGQIGIKYNHDEEEYKFVNVDVRKSRGRPVVNWPPLYENLLPISDAKKRDLQSLCAQKLIPQEFHPWIDSLPVGNQTIESDSEPENN